ncbi:GDP-mannose 4,6-dehydratase [Nocardioides yefusunii]|uniref:GDP-mannose 4,6-dehydratase n=1 Tax=Nocardioides yefusunii TaxID=2500546 RepID=A0ABW1QX37_9ACTN|nr:GDP-mannose 4,6-dehydratase [Nocardioides yefusunii]
MSSARRRALITGSAGQDGSYLAEQLLADGYAVHGLVRPRPDGSVVRPEFVPDAVVLHGGDVTDHAATAALVAEVNPDEVYNLAAISSVARSWTEPDLVRAVNGDAAIALLDACVAVGARFVQASSAEIFGAPTQNPQTEDTPLAPTNPYGEAKAAAHEAVQAARATGKFAVNAVLYNHESPRRPNTFVTRKITQTVAAIARGEADELVLGTTSVRRDWGWAPDHVDAMVRAARHDVAQDYVVATGVGHSVHDLAAAAFAHVGISDWERFLRIDQAYVRPNDAPVLLGDASRARLDLGWVPTRTFEEMVAEMVDADLG